MSGVCSAHLWYERECSQCQSGKPQWVADLEARVQRLQQWDSIACVSVTVRNAGFALHVPVDVANEVAAWHKAAQENAELKQVLAAIEAQLSAALNTNVVTVADQRRVIEDFFAWMCENFNKRNRFSRLKQSGLEVGERE